MSSYTCTYDHVTHMLCLCCSPAHVCVDVLVKPYSVTYVRVRINITMFYTASAHLGWLALCYPNYIVELGNVMSIESQHSG